MVFGCSSKNDAKDQGVYGDVVRPSYAIYDNSNYYGNQFVCRNCDEPSWQYILKGKPIREVKLLPCEHCGCHELQRRKAFWTKV